MSKARILIVEDEAIVAMELQYVLEDLGHEVAGVAGDTRTVRRLVSEGPIDLALLDIHLSDGPTGIQLGRELSAAGVTVLFMTANPGMLRNGVEGTVGVLCKPVDEYSVQTAVNYALGRRAGLSVDRAPPELRLFGQGSASTRPRSFRLPGG